ncbi:MAG TPA: tetratricopeptide repeat protein [Smithella sp.]|nr:tetratricopeptide repeat protein [Smithella sp.]
MANKINISTRYQILIVYAVLTLAALAVFWQTHQFNFINLDDVGYVTAYSNIEPGIANGLSWAFSTRFADLWHPLVWLSFILDYQLWGLTANGYHVTNLILHILSTLLLFWLFNRMTGAIWKSAFVAALFALHPFHVESVAWISERKDVLSAFFWMLTLCLYVYYTEKPCIKRYLPVVFSFVLALLSKPMVVTLPFILLLLDYWPLNRLESQTNATAQADDEPASINKGKKKNKADKAASKKNIPPTQAQKLPETKIAGIIPIWHLWEKIPFFVLSAVMIIITLYNPNQSQTSQHALSLGSRFANAPVAFVTYLVKTLWPYDLSVFYPFSDQIPAWQVVGATLLIIAISAAAVVMAKRLPYILMGWLWFAITILPVIGIIQLSSITPYAMADRYHYLPSIGLAVMIAWGVPFLFRQEVTRKNILFPAGLAVLAIMAILSWRQCGYWRDSITLFNHSLRVTNDNYLAHSNLCDALIGEGKIREAIAHCSETIRINPDYYIAYNNRGNAYSKLGMYQQTIEDLNQAIRLNPQSFEALNNRGSAYIKLGQNQLAMADLNEAIRLNPDYALSYANRAAVYLNQGQKELGCRDAQRACSLGDCGILELARKKGDCR